MKSSYDLFNIDRLYELKKNAQEEQNKLQKLKEELSNKKVSLSCLIKNIDQNSGRKGRN